jgi:23S rRNA G2445 N2-methylase RlmL
MNDAISFLDPTRGSGTFLAFALARGASVQGWDTDESCVNGAFRKFEVCVWQRLYQGWQCASARDASKKNLYGETKNTIALLQTSVGDKIMCNTLYGTTMRMSTF